MYSEADAATRVRNVTALTKMSAARKKVYIYGVEKQHP